MSKFYNIDTSTNLGGVDASDIKVSSQKSIKTYIDGGMQTVAYIGSDESTSDVIDSATGNPIASKWLKDVNDVNFFPVTHVDSVKDDNNVPLSTLLDGKQDLITTGNKLEWDLVDHPDIPTVYDATLTIKKNGTSVGTFTANASSNKTINIKVPTTASDVDALPSSTKYGASLDMSLNSSTYVLTVQLNDQDGNNLGEAKTVDLPLESMVTGGSYDNTTKKITLTQQSGSNVEISIEDIINGLQPAINSTNKLSADYISNGTTNKVYTATEKTKLSGIEKGAEVNVQSDWNVDDNSSDAFIKNKPTIGNGTLTIWQNQTSKGTFTANQTTSSDITITVPTKTSDLTNDSGFLNGDSKLNSLQDVSITSASNNQSLVYENGMWKNKTLQSVTTLQELYDTNVNPTKTGEIITYNETTQKWTNSTGVLDCYFTLHNDETSTEEFPMNTTYTCDKTPEEIQYAFEHNWTINAYMDVSVLAEELKLGAAKAIIKPQTYITQENEGVTVPLLYTFDVSLWLLYTFYYTIGYNVSTNTWLPVYDGVNSIDLDKLKDLRLHNLNDVNSVMNPQLGEALVYNGTEWTNGYPNEPVSITYSELVTLRNNSTLVPNRTYRITDYVTEINPYMTNLIYYMEGMLDSIPDMEIARVSPNYVQYDILVTAIDSSHLSEDCRIVPHSGVTFFDNYDITSWKLKYTIDNDVERFAWAKNYYNVTLTLDDGTVNGVMIKTKLKLKVNNVEGFDTYLFTAKVDGQCVNYIFGMENGHTPAASEIVYEIMQGAALTINSATQVLGKGVVYSMEDCFSNKLCYDYLNIQYKLYAITDVTTTDSNLNECLSELKTALLYNADGTKARLSSIVSASDMARDSITITTDFNNFDWYYTFDLYDETYNTHKNVFYLCDNVTLEKSLSSCYYMYGKGTETWNLPYNVFQYNKSYVTFQLNDMIEFSKPVLLHSLDLSEYVYGNVWYYDGTFLNDYTSLVSSTYVETPKHVYGTIFANSYAIKTNGCYNGTIINSLNVNIENSSSLFYYNLSDSTIGQLCYNLVCINNSYLDIGTNFNGGYFCNCSQISVGNNCEVRLIGKDNMSDISIGNNSSIYINIDDTDESKWIRDLYIGNHVYVSTVNSEKFTGIINGLTIGDKCNIKLKNDLSCNNIVVEPNTDNVILTSEGLPSGQYLSSIIVRNTTHNVYGNLSTDFITESFNTPHKVGRNSSGVVVCYVEEDLVAPVAYAPNAVTYTVSGNDITFTIPSGYTMYWTLDGRNPSKLVNDGSASTSTTVTLTDGQTIKYISYNSSLPQDRWATQIYSYTHHVNV